MIFPKMNFPFSLNTQIYQKSKNAKFSDKRKHIKVKYLRRGVIWVAQMQDFIMLREEAR